MCANYTPARQAAWDRAIKAVYPLGEFNPEAFPGHVAPIRTNEPRDDGVLATFGLLPHWARPELVRSTYNARSETAASKPSFRNAWKKGQFCIIPADGIFEPCYDSGRAVRWRITHRDGAPLGIAGLWESRPVGDSVQYSFSMLTISAAGHPIMQHMHKPEDEKRMVVILDPDDYADWLATPPERALGWMRQYPAEWLSAEPAPRGGAAQLSLI
ncbi:SOS response-associated peptidase [Methyloversatilis sp. XJ19-13]|uniref:SOS response-associated peptidase n=1 Tax=Methyloversatilis sp. XJ19-13 TaxID=2963430 RepID=UPI00211B9DF7|nr:SOS response-associated peptidase [Methyloversatilis sp. XJ19-13]MCQ9375687.1 SOS response-associated peptidase [Methyloversatilis sp. XJ19-13]